MAPQGSQWATAANQHEAQLIAMIDDLQRQVRELQETNQRSKPRQVLPTPERFEGRARDWETWSLSMRAKLRIDGTAIGDGAAQLHYVYASLDIKVQGLVLAFMRKAEREGAQDPFALIQYLERIYDDPNKARKAGQRLREMEQGSMSLATYLPRFERTLFEAGAEAWPDDAKITTLVGGLSKEAKQRLDGQLTLPTEYDAFIRMLLTLDGHFKEQGDSMDWETTRVSKAKVAPAVTKGQRQEWRDQGRCVRCGSKQHWVQSCKFQPTRNRSPSQSSTKDESMAMVTMKSARTKTTAKRVGFPEDSDTEGTWEDYDE